MGSRETTSAVHSRLRDTLYMDSERVRALLAQVRGGVVDAVVERWGSNTEQRLGARVFGLEGGRNLLDEASTEQTTTLQDALLDVFEESAEATSLFSDAVLDDTGSWRSGGLHALLAPGELVRVTAPTQIIDAQHVAGEITRALELIHNFAFFQEAVDPTPMPALGPSPPPKARGGQRRDRLEPDAFKQAVIAARVAGLLGDFSVEAAVAVAEIFQKILGKGIAVRVFPCGLEHRDLALVGHLAQRDGYLRDTPETLFAKYGWGASTWTVIAQLATVPVKIERASAAAEEPDVTNTTEAPEGGVDRAELENLGIGLMQTLADGGLIGAPRFPGITITPIAIYRTVAIRDPSGGSLPAQPGT